MASKSKTLSPKTSAILLGLIGVILTGGAGYLAYMKYEDLGTRVAAKAVVEEFVETKDSDGKAMYAPRFVFKDAKGAEFRVTSMSRSASPGYKKGQSVDVLYQPGAPEKATIDSFWENWAGIAIAGGVGLLLLLLAPFAARPPPKTGAAGVNPLSLEERLYFHPLDAGTMDAFLSTSPGAGLPVGGGVTAGANVIPEGRYPVPLCEFCSYMAALVYVVDPEKIATHLRENCPGITQFRFLSNQNTEGFAFQFEGVAFIVLRGTEQKRADWLRNFKALRTGPTDFIPPGVKWVASARHSGFAEGWDVIRGQVEAWIAETRPADQSDMPFIFTGHSLGGALSFLGAYEFAKLGRNVKAVITFGAALPGGPAFAREYEQLGLDVKTLRLEFDKDAVPVAQFPLLYLPVGFVWQLDKPPLTARERTKVEQLKSGMVSVLQKGLSASVGEGGGARLFHSPLTALFSVLIYGVPAALTAVKSHSMQQRYSLALSVLSYRRLRELGVKDHTESEYAACYDRMCHYLERLRGEGPQDPKLFTFMKELPLRLTSKAELDALTTKFPDNLL